MLASTLGIDLDADVAWNKGRKVYETSDLIVDTLSITRRRGRASRVDLRQGMSWLLTSAEPPQ